MRLNPFFVAWCRRIVALWIFALLYAITRERVMYAPPSAMTGHPVIVTSDPMRENAIRVAVHAQSRPYATRGW